MAILEGLVHNWLSAVCGSQFPSYGSMIDIMTLPSDRMSLASVTLTEYSMAEVAEHCGPDSCWLVLWDMVFDVTPFLKEHPGSEELLLEHAGKDATTVFSEVGHSRDAKMMLAKYNIGILQKGDRIFIDDYRTK